MVHDTQSLRRGKCSTSIPVLVTILMMMPSPVAVSRSAAEMNASLIRVRALSLVIFTWLLSTLAMFFRPTWLSSKGCIIAPAEPAVRYLYKNKHNISNWLTPTFNALCILTCAFPYAQQGRRSRQHPCPPDPSQPRWLMCSMERIACGTSLWRPAEPQHLWTWASSARASTSMGKCFSLLQFQMENAFKAADLTFIRASRVLVKVRISHQHPAHPMTVLSDSL